MSDVHAAALVEPSRMAVHYRGAAPSLAYCGEGAPGHGITPDPQHVSCALCLSLMARVDPLLLLAPEEALIIGRLRLLRTNGDYAMLVMWQEGHLKVNRVLAAR